jgi:hypothetical protein
MELRMDDDELDPQLADAIEKTSVVRPPRQALATFGTTAVRYYLVTEPAFRDLPGAGIEPESVVREGVVRAERPQVVTPYFLSRHEGFGDHTQEYLNHLIERYGPDSPGLLYTYKNEAMETSIVTGTPDEVAARIGERLDREERALEAVVRGVDEMWDVSLMKFIYELTNRSARSNFDDLRTNGLLGVDNGVPREARHRIERLMDLARAGKADPADVHRELERWGLFEEYQDRFLGLFLGR